MLCRFVFWCSATLVVIVFVGCSDGCAVCGFGCGLFAVCFLRFVVGLFVVVDCGAGLGFRVGLVGCGFWVFWGGGLI